MTERNINLTETGRLTEAEGAGRVRLRIIEAGRGSSGVYPEETLQEAAREQVFRAGTLCYLDHPSASEAADRPERSVRDLAGRLAEDAVFENGALVAEAEVFSHMRPVIEGLAETVGISIRAMGDIDESGTVTRITEARSVDYVTEAGAGGRVMELLESARSQPVNEARNAADWIEVEIHRHVMGLANAMWGEGGTLTRSEWESVAAATAEAMSAFRARLTADAPQLADRDPLVQTGTEQGVGIGETTRQSTTEGTHPGSQSGAGAPSGADHEEDTDMPVGSTGPSEGATQTQTTQEGAETSAGTEGAEVAETTTPAAGEGQVLDERDRRIENLELALYERDARDEVRRHVATHAADLPEAARARVAGSVDLGSDDLEEAVKDGAKRERAYIAEVAGTGRVTGMGGGDPLTETDDEGVNELIEAYKASGYSDEDAEFMARL